MKRNFDSLTRLSQQKKPSGRNGEKMYSVTNRRYFRRHVALVRICAHDLIAMKSVAAMP